uniref:Chromosome 3 open reading frame 33 n=1 Tax=Taeniopygia guttata TaxID=59729 RepID=A0A674GBA1_TAEGU
AVSRLRVPVTPGAVSRSRVPVTPGAVSRFPVTVTPGAVHPRLPRGRSGRGDAGARRRRWRRRWRRWRGRLGARRAGPGPALRVGGRAPGAAAGTGAGRVPGRAGTGAAAGTGAGRAPGPGGHRGGGSPPGPAEPRSAPQGLIAGAAVAGVLLLARSLRLTTKFTSPLDIPVEFVQKNVKLRGKLHHITEKGLEVEHIPISIPFISAIQRKWQPEGLLLIRLAGVELAAGGTAWLQRELLPKQPLWFQLLGRDSSALECLVLVQKGGFFSTCLNEELLSQGLARAARIEGLPHHSHLYWKLHKRLLQAELKAVKKNKGIWKEQSYSERVQEHINSNKFLQRLKQFVSWVRSSAGR